MVTTVELVIDVDMKRPAVLGDIVTKVAGVTSRMGHSFIPNITQIIDITVMTIVRNKITVDDITNIIPEN